MIGHSREIKTDLHVHQQNYVISIQVVIIIIIAVLGLQMRSWWLSDYGD
jgi:hypothetical protein